MKPTASINKPEEYFALPADDTAIMARITALRASIESIEADLCNPARMENRTAAEYMAWRARAENAKSISAQEIAFLNERLAERRVKNQAEREARRQELQRNTEARQQARQEMQQTWEAKYGSLLPAQLIMQILDIMQTTVQPDYTFTPEQCEVLAAARMYIKELGLKNA